MRRLRLWRLLRRHRFTPKVYPMSVDLRLADHLKPFLMIAQDSTEITVKTDDDDTLLLLSFHTPSTLNITPGGHLHISGLVTTVSCTEEVKEKQEQ